MWSAFRTRNRKSCDAASSATLAVVDDALHDQLAHALHLVLHLREPHRGVDVAQAARSLLELRLEEKDRVAVALMAVAALGELLAIEARGVLLQHLGLHRLLEAGVEHVVAAQVAGVEQRRLHLQVLLRQAGAGADRAARVTDGETGVPERVEDALGDGLDVGVHPPRVEHEEIDVGLGVQLAPAVAPLRRDRAAVVGEHVPARVLHRRGMKEELDQAIDRRGVRADDRATARARTVGVGDPDADGREKLLRDRAQVGDAVTDRRQLG